MRRGAALADMFRDVLDRELEVRPGKVAALQD